MICFLLRNFQWLPLFQICFLLRNYQRHLLFQIYFLLRNYQKHLPFQIYFLPQSSQRRLLFLHQNYQKYLVSPIYYLHQGSQMLFARNCRSPIHLYLSILNSLYCSQKQAFSLNLVSECFLVFNLGYQVFSFIPLYHRQP